MKTLEELMENLNTKETMKQVENALKDAIIFGKGAVLIDNELNVKHVPFKPFEKPFTEE